MGFWKKVDEFFFAMEPEPKCERCGFAKGDHVTVAGSFGIEMVNFSAGIVCPTSFYKPVTKDERKDVAEN